jgi:transposase
MGRHFSGNVHTSTRQERRKNGDIYVLERTIQYDQVTGKTRTLETKLLGKIPAGEAEMVATRPKKPNGFATLTATRKHVGMTAILDWVGRESGIDEDVCKSFSSGDAAKIISIARYWLATDGGTLPRLESWQITHELPYSQGISEDVYGELFRNLGYNETGIQKYFSCRAKRLSRSPVIAYDSTTISTYSENQHEARQGFNKDRDGLPTIKLLTLYSVKDREPIAFAKQPGNIPDVIAVGNTLEQLKCFDIDKPMVATDNGFYSLDNIRLFCQRNMKFLTLIDSGVNLARNVIDELRDKLEDMAAGCPFDLNISGASVMKMQTFKWKRKREGSGKKAGDTETMERRLYFYVFHSEELANQHRLNFKKQLNELRCQLEEGATEFTDAAKERIEQYFTLSKMGRGGRLHITFNEDACAEAKKNFGYFVLVSNCPLDVFEALSDYRLREKIEELFKDEKECADSRRIRVWYGDTLRGRQMAQFVSICYRCFLMKKIKEVEEGLCKDEASMTKEQYGREKKLKSWIQQRSLAQILDWFDCVDTTTVNTEAGKRRWTTETVERDRFFLERLGVTK